MSVKTTISPDSVEEAEDDLDDLNASHENRSLLAAQQAQE